MIGGGGKVVRNNNFKIHIDYSDFSKKDEVKYFNNMAFLEVSWDELLDAIVTCGMPLYYLTNWNKKMRKKEIEFKIQLVDMSLEIDYSGYVTLSNELNYLDSSEKVFVMYYLGMLFTKIASKKIFEYDYLVHLKLAEKYKSIKYNSKKRPDFLGFKLSDNDYAIFEAKGRMQLKSGLFTTAKRQVNSVTWVQGSKAKLGIVSVVHVKNNQLCCHLKDPDPTSENRFEFDKIDLIDFYYSPIFDLIDDEMSNENKKISREDSIDKNREDSNSYEVEFPILDDGILHVEMNKDLYLFMKKVRSRHYSAQEKEELVLELKKIYKTSEELYSIREK
jgi:hypothetical protein